MYRSTVHYKKNLSLLKRSASVRLERLGRASLGINRVEVGARQSGRVVGRVERVGCGRQTLEVLAVVRVGLSS